MLKGLISITLVLMALGACSVYADDPVDDSDADTVVDIPLVVEPKQINVSVWYNGGEVTVSGEAPSGTEAVIVVLRSSGTPPMALARKGRVVLFWMTVKKFKVENIPGVYQIALSAPLRHIMESLSIEEVEANQIGYAALKQGWKVERTSGAESSDDIDVLFNGLVKLKEKAGVYRVNENGVQLQANGSFSTVFPISDATTVGEYAIIAYSIRGGTIVNKGLSEFVVEKVGLVKWLSDMATHHAGAYGVIAVVIALCTGMVVSLIFKGKGGH